MELKLGDDDEIIRVIKSRFQDIRCSRVEHLINMMANPVRFHILCALTEQPFTVSQLVSICEANLSNVSQQLKMMWVAGYVDKERKGKQILYWLKDQRIAALIRNLEKLYPPEQPGCEDFDTD